MAEGGSQREEIHIHAAYVRVLISKHATQHNTARAISNLLSPEKKHVKVFNSNPVIL